MKCYMCDGTGKIYQDNFAYESWTVCIDCKGTGEIKSANEVLDKVAENIEEEKIRNEVIIQSIQDIRTENNKAWMNLLRLAFESAPHAAKLIFKQITENDRKINELSKELCE